MTLRDGGRSTGETGALNSDRRAALRDSFCPSWRRTLTPFASPFWSVIQKKYSVYDLSRSYPARQRVSQVRSGLLFKRNIQSMTFRGHGHIPRGTLPSQGDVIG